MPEIQSAGKEPISSAQVVPPIVSSQPGLCFANESYWIKTLMEAGKQYSPPVGFDRFTFGPKPINEKNFISLVNGVLIIHDTDDLSSSAQQRVSLLPTAFFGISQTPDSVEYPWYQKYQLGEVCINELGSLTHVSKYLFTMLDDINIKLRELAADDPDRDYFEGQQALISDTIQIMGENKNRHPLFDIEQLIYMHKSGMEVDTDFVQDIFNRYFAINKDYLDKGILANTLLSKSYKLADDSLLVALNHIVLGGIDFGDERSSVLSATVRRAISKGDEGLKLIYKMLENGYDIGPNRSSVLATIAIESRDLGDKGLGILKHMLKRSARLGEDAPLVHANIVYAAGSMGEKGLSVILSMLDNNYDFVNHWQSVSIHLATAATRIKGKGGIKILNMLIKRGYSLGPDELELLAELKIANNLMGINPLRFLTSRIKHLKRFRSSKHKSIVKS